MDIWRLFRRGDDHGVSQLGMVALVRSIQTRGHYAARRMRPSFRPPQVLEYRKKKGGFLKTVCQCLVVDGCSRDHFKIAKTLPRARVVKRSLSSFLMVGRGQGLAYLNRLSLAASYPRWVGFF
jgi:hypothetical protein